MVASERHEVRQRGTGEWGNEEISAQETNFGKETRLQPMKSKNSLITTNEKSLCSGCDQWWGSTHSEWCVCHL